MQAISPEPLTRLEVNNHFRIGQQLFAVERSFFGGRVVRLCVYNTLSHFPMWVLRWRPVTYVDVANELLAYNVRKLGA
jgi:hypothetical protein